MFLISAGTARRLFLLAMIAAIALALASLRFGAAVMVPVAVCVAFLLGAASAFSRVHASGQAEFLNKIRETRTCAEIEGLAETSLRTAAASLLFSAVLGLCVLAGWQINAFFHGIWGALSAFALTSGTTYVRACLVAFRTPRP